MNLKDQIKLETSTGVNIDWDEYRENLMSLNESKRELQNKLSYAKIYLYGLETGNAQDLLKVSNGCRSHVM